MTSDTGIESAVQQLAALFQDKTREEQMELLAALERAGAGVYRSLAENESDEVKRRELLQAAAREEQNADVLDEQR